MEANSILTYIQSHGYIVLFLSLFFGIVGIPAPEESLLFLVGIFISHDQLHLFKSLFFAVFGATVGMVIAYVAGYTFGSPLLFKYGHYIGFHRRRYRYMYRHFRKRALWVITFGYFIPGVRQLSPYMAGVVRFPFLPFLCLSFAGATFWISLFVCVGKLLGERIHIPLHVLPWLTLLFFSLFFIILYMKKRKQS
ncbi:DedA family protein [Anoxybacillus sp. ST4]|uniref:DedA family protein n=1 Tax=Anoxybacillus sp. ST4 TaxID=2864181 RepID=UPI001C63E14F|nr:DedA family protein [Anoxybacillus sp. ST4]MBW7651921.1 DedA family protein [Anoxybacillus sp. ST4]